MLRSAGVKRPLYISSPIKRSSMDGGVVHLWSEWEVQILVLLSFALQLSLLMFAWMRRRNTSAVPRTLLWLAYLLADSTAIYILGHMSISYQPREHQELMAFWAPFLLLHLGGQDTITAYAMEDNQLWPRHLLSLVMQATGAAYVLYKYMAGSGTLAVASVLIFLAGVVKYGERIWALKSSNLDRLRMFLNNVEKPKLRSELLPERPQGEGRLYSVSAERIEGDSEAVLQGAHYLLPICMGQFVGYKFWPSRYQSRAVKLFSDKDRMYELIEMQLSLMHDVLYTKAAVIHTWYGCFVHAFSSAATAAAFFLFQSSSSSANSKESNLNRADVVVTYTLLVGAVLIEIVSLLGAMGSTWTCALLRARKWHRLHRTVAGVRKLVKADERIRRWPGSIGQHNLCEKYMLGESHGWTSTMVRKVCGFIWPHHSSFTTISADTKRLVLEEIERIVGACGGNEAILRRYRGQCALKPYESFFRDLTDIGFDDSILEWHFATDLLFLRTTGGQAQQQEEEILVLETTIRALSNYMMFLLRERPYMLPSPARPVLYDRPLRVDGLHGSEVRMMTGAVKSGNYWGDDIFPSFTRGADLAERLVELNVPLRVVLGVWVEMLCYAAHHCSRDSHARQLNSGGEFITIAWVLTTASFNRSYCDERWFKVRVRNFFQPSPRKQSVLDKACLFFGYLLDKMSGRRLGASGPSRIIL